MTEISSKEEFEKVLSLNKPTVLDFYAQWCGPCKSITPHLKQLQNEYNDSVEFCSIDVDKIPELAEKYGILSVPTLLFTSDGGENYREKVGSITYANIKKEVETFFSKSAVAS